MNTHMVCSECKHLRISQNFGVVREGLQASRDVLEVEPRTSNCHLPRTQAWTLIFRRQCSRQLGTCQQDDHASQSDTEVQIVFHDTVFSLPQRRMHAKPGPVARNKIELDPSSWRRTLLTKITKIEYCLEFAQSHACYYIINILPTAAVLSG